MLASACVNQLPAQDRRILEARPVAKLSVEVLARDYQKDARAADAQYWGKAIEISGGVGSTRNDAGATTLLFNDQSGAAIVEAGLLDDQAAAIVASSADAKRITLVCYCDGLKGRVILKSCIAR